MSEPDQAIETDKRSPAEERAYFLQRALDHAGMADQAADSATQAIHARLHQLYEERASLITVVDTD